MNTILIIAGFSGALLVVLSFFSNINWPTRLRILTAALAGFILMGLLAWTVVKPMDSNNIVNINSLPKIVIVAAIAIGISILSYLITWPHGSKIAPIAVPFGLSVWAAKTPQIADVFRTMDTTEQRLGFYRSILIEPFIWLFVIAAAMVTIYVCRSLFENKSVPKSDDNNKIKNQTLVINFVIAVAASVAIAHFLIPVFAQDVKMQDVELGWLVAQPANGQIAFAVFIVFGCTSFIVKKFLSVNYTAGILACAILSTLTYIIYMNNGKVEYLTENWPAVFFINPHAAILPIQMLAFGTLGSLAGYWTVIYHELWQKSEHHKMTDTSPI